MGEELRQYRENRDEPSYESMLEDERTEFWVTRYTEDQARSYLYPLDKAIDVDYIITAEPRKSSPQAYFVTSCKEICNNRVSVRGADDWWALDSRTKVPRVDTGAVYTGILAMLKKGFTDRPPLLDVPVLGAFGVHLAAYLPESSRSTQQTT